MKKILLLILLLSVLTLPVRADTVYDENYRSSGAAELTENLPQDSRRQLQQLEIDPSDPDWVSALSPETVFAHLLGLFKGGAKRPVSSAAVSMGLILVTAAFLPNERKNLGGAVQLAATAATALIFVTPLISSVQSAANAVKGCGTFMLSFAPVFAGVCVASGGSFTAASTHALLVLAAQVTVSLATFSVLPFCGSYLAMHLCAGVSPLSGAEHTAGAVRKIAVWFLTLLVTVFVGILGIQTAVKTAADSVALKTTKYIVGTAVPIAGSAMAEATSAVYASIGLLRSSLGAFGVVGIGMILLPTLAELLIWRLCAAVCGQAAAIFSLSPLQKIYKAVDQMLSLLVTVLLLTGAVFIIALSVVQAGLRAL
ncbi:MAG: stage III sporulation protein AE [Clostridia bacterium]|nr:stage III sporulation protein AE [Clostridia bacterium]